MKIHNYSIIIIVTVISQQLPWQIIIKAPNPDGSNTLQVHELFREGNAQSAKTPVKSGSKHRSVVYFVKNNKKVLLQNHNGEVSNGSEKFTQNGFWNMSYEERSEVYT